MKHNPDAQLAALEHNVVCLQMRPTSKYINGLHLKSTDCSQEFGIFIQHIVLNLTKYTTDVSRNYKHEAT